MLKCSGSSNFRSNRYKITVLLHTHSVRIAQISLGFASGNMAKYAPQKCEATLCYFTIVRYVTRYYFVQMNCTPFNNFSHVS